LTASTSPPLTNRLLAALPAPARKRFIEGCEEIELVFGEVLVEADQRTRYVYFPTRGVISTVAVMSRGASLQVGLVGSEGMLGCELLLDVTRAPWQAYVQGSGTALRIAAADFRLALGASPSLRQRLNRYIYVLMQQLVQVAFCARNHHVDARLARWLLMTQDRACSDQFHATQEFMAHVLGVRRVGVTEAASALKALGAIQYTRGDVHIVDRAGLQDSACLCYMQDNEHYDRIMSTGPRLQP